MKEGLLVFLLSVALYALTAPVNRTEAEDAYDYAWTVENVAGADLLDGQRLLFFPVARGLFLVAGRWLGVRRALPVLIGFSVIATAGYLAILFRLLRTRMGFSRRDAWMGVGLIGSLYGVWRYAAESEVYGPSALVAGLLLLVAVRPSGDLAASWRMGACAVLATLTHIMNLPLALALGLLLLIRRKFAAAARYALVCALGLGLAFAVAFAWGLDFESVMSVAPGGGGTWPRWSSGPRMLVGIGSASIASQFVFAFEIVRARLPGLLPSLLMTEESFMGRAFGPAWGIAGLATLGLGAAALLRVARCALRAPAQSAPDPAADGAKTVLHLTLLYLALYTAVILRFNPAATEFWVQAVPFLGLALLAALRAGGRMAAARPALLMLALASIAHNGIVGMLPLKFRSADLNAVKAAPVLERATDRDLVLTGDNPKFFRYLRYYSPARVLDLYGVSWGRMDAVEREILDHPGRVYAFDDLGDPPAAVRSRLPEPSERAEAIGLRLRDRFERLAVTRAGEALVRKEEGGGGGNVQRSTLNAQRSTGGEAGANVER